MDLSSGVNQIVCECAPRHKTYIMDDGSFSVSGGYGNSNGNFNDEGALDLLMNDGAFSVSGGLR